MYINGFVISVPEDKKAEYRDQIECWEADVKDGKVTDFRRAVDLKPGDATADASHEKMMADPRMKQFGDDMPFDAKRMIFGGSSALTLVPYPQ